MRDIEILPEHFMGEWLVVVSATGAPRHVKIFEDRGQYFFETEEGIRFPAEYDPTTDNMHVHDADICISFWRHPSMDHIFARGKRSSEQLWGARRQREEFGTGRIRGHERIREDICGEWNVTITTRTKRPGPGSTVVIERAGIGRPEGSMTPIRRRLNAATPELFYLFEVTDRSAECYDILAFDRRTVTFNSIFRVRSINYWPEENMIFAMFDNRFKLPLGHFEGAPREGRNRLGKLMQFEVEAEALATPGNPNTGCWTANGG